MDSTSTVNNAAAGAFVGTFFVGYLIFMIVVYLVVAFILSKVFVKAGKPGWAAFVPLYNGWVLFEIGGQPGWWVLSAIIPFIGPVISLVLYVIVSLEIAKRFGKSQTFGIVGLWLFSIIGYAMLAFDDSKYQGVSAPVAAKSNGSNKPEALNDDTSKDS